MVEALAGLGHTGIAFLAGPRALFVARDRLEGYRRGLAAAGLPDDDRLVVHTGFDRDGGALGVDTLLAGDAPFTAIACANDLLALGALARLESLGIAVPGAVSVAGFDDISVAAITAPALSTVRMPLREMGRLGFRRAEAALGGEIAPRDHLPLELVLRASTGAPPARPLPHARTDALSPPATGATA
jgi:DNA-binding LacI/PurR family transcriptional regulator